MDEKLGEFLRRKEVLKELRRLAAAGQKSLVIEFDSLLNFNMDLAKVLRDSPADFIDTADKILTDITKLPGMRLRVKSLDKSIPIRKIRAENVGNFIQVDGLLKRVGEVKPELKEAVFKCLRCGEENRVPQIDEVYREPLACENPNCGKRGPFKLVIENSEFRDWQSLMMQERPEELRGGQIPRLIDAIVRDEFVDKAVPGNRVIMTGTLRVFQERQQRERKTTFRKVLFVSHIEVLQKGIEEAELSPEDEEKIKELAKDPWVKNLVIQSIAPSIYGYDSVKEAIALQLFGCNAVDLPDGTRIRGDTHVLMTGDPGVAKSAILKWVAAISPRGLYTSGKKATGAGLTAAAVRDELGGGWALEAGVLVIADGGLACVDEFDKMSDEDSGAILESMEQQTISVAKAGIIATLNTRTAILAASNPAFGRFDRNRPLAEQLNVPPVLLSRFDLIFVMKDEPHADTDRAVAKHILQLHSDATRVVKPPIDSETLRKMIIYARKYIDPQFKDKEVLKAIEDFFVKWRSTAESGASPIPITPRQLEALVRLSKANARMRLSKEVTIEDANRAIDLVKRSLHEAGIDPESGKVDIDILMTGKSRSQRQNIERIQEIIKDLEGQFGGAAPIEEIKKLASAEGIRERFVDQMIEEEKRRGHLYEPKPGLVSRAVK
jgi:replicative DNA helicase Mcm